ncbi:MAG: hypothetical protein JXM68_01730, partial [Sedimentisphaerales bacterium]|nr:hypothetical protein [Sedimentisphaerales bacterium]
TLISLLAFPVSVRVFQNLHTMSLDGAINELDRMADSAGLLAVTLNCPVTISVDVASGDVALGYAQGIADSGISPRKARGLSLSEIGLEIVRLEINGRRVSGKGSMVFLPDGTGDYGELELKNSTKSAVFYSMPYIEGTGPGSRNNNRRVIDLDASLQYSTDIFR